MTTPRPPAPRPISLRPPAELLARIDQAVPGSPQANRTAWIVEACEQRLRHDAVLRHAAGTAVPGDHPRAACPYPAGCTGCTPDTVQERAARGEPDAVARMQVAGQLAPGYLTEAGLEHLSTELAAGIDADGDVEGADYPPQPATQGFTVQASELGNDWRPSAHAERLGLVSGPDPEPVRPIAGADITIEVTPVAGGAIWRWKVAHPDLAEPIEGSESFRSAILDSARNIVRGKVGHGDFVLRLPKGVAR